MQPIGRVLIGHDQIIWQDSEDILRQDHDVLNYFQEIYNDIRMGKNIVLLRLGRYRPIQAYKR